MEIAVFEILSLGLSSLFHFLTFIIAFIPIGVQKRHSRQASDCSWFWSMAMSKVSDPVMLLATLPLQVEPPPPEDPSRCRLLGPTALIVQAISASCQSWSMLMTCSVGIVVISSLIIKRQLESRKRPWRIWLWDVGKQLVGQAVIHALNLLVSRVGSQVLTGRFLIKSHRLSTIIRAHCTFSTSSSTPRLVGINGSAGS